MRIQINTLSAGPGGVRQPGDIIDVNQAEADALIAGGFASAVDRPPTVVTFTPPPVETATAEPQAETATIKQPKKKRV